MINFIPGEWYICTEDLYMESGEMCFTDGLTYEAVSYDALLDDQEDYHIIGGDWLEHFTPVKGKAKKQMFQYG